MSIEQIKQIYSEKLMSLSDETLKKLLGDDYNSLIEYDEWIRSNSKKIEKEWKKEYKKIINQIFEFRKENEDFARERRIEYLENLIVELSKKIEKELEYQQRMIDNDVPFWFRSLSNDRLKRMIKEYKGLKNSLYFLKNNKNQNGITPEMIVRAREYPIDNLIEVGKNMMALCPFHSDKNPSMYVKNNFYYCFGCGASGDVIDLAMKLWGISFPEAVKKLSTG